MVWQCSEASLREQRAECGPTSSLREVTCCCLRRRVRLADSLFIFRLHVLDHIYVWSKMKGGQPKRHQNQHLKVDGVITFKAAAMHQRASQGMVLAVCLLPESCQRRPSCLREPHCTQDSAFPH